MGNINSDLNQFLPPPKDSAVPDGEIADHGHGATKSTSTAAKTSSAKSTSGDGRRKPPNDANKGILSSILGNIHSRSAEGVSETSY